MSQPLVCSLNRRRQEVEDIEEINIPCAVSGVSSVNFIVFSRLEKASRSDVACAQHDRCGLTFYVGLRLPSGKSEKVHQSIHA